MVQRWSFIFWEIDKEDVESCDICSDGSHVGIVSKYGSIINANGEKIIENELGFRDNQYNAKFLALYKTP